MNGRPEPGMGPKVSVILPTFNRLSSLKAAMLSVLTQSYADLELIVVDDASPEDVEGLVRGICDDRVRYVRRPTNGGAAAARNTGLAHARGEFIAFQDSDDIWLPGKLERQFRIFAAAPASVGVVTGAKVVYGRDAAFSYGPSKVALAPPPAGQLRLDEDQFDHLLGENRLSVQNALFRRDCYPGPDWFDVCARANEDWEFAIRLATRTTILEDGEPVVMGFVSADSISSNFRKQTIGVLRILRKNRDVLQANKARRAELLIDVGRSLFLAGRFRSARRFVLAGLRDRPAYAVKLLPALIKRAIGKIPMRGPAPQKPASAGVPLKPAARPRFPQQPASDVR